MTFEKGGRADKFGNRYERMWVAKQLLHLLREEIASVTLEAVGEDEEGVDVWIELKDGNRVAQQCKSRNGDNESWTVQRLAASGVLTKMKRHLERKSGTQFVFASALPATGLGDLCSSARNSPEDGKAFITHQLNASRKVTFDAYSRAMGLDPAVPVDQFRAFDFMKRTHLVLFSDDISTEETLLTEIEHLLTGPKGSTLTYLMTALIDHDYLGKPIDSHTLYDLLAKEGVHPKNLAHDSRIMPVVQKLQTEFRESITPVLIRNQVIHRDETDCCLKGLQDNGMVILHGSAGAGKSGILLELTSRLNEDGACFLPLRLDRRMPCDNAKAFGEGMQLPDSPAFCLAAIAKTSTSVLIIDQLDAIRWTSSHSTTALDVCKELVRQVMHLREFGNDIKVILSCRTYDLTHDPEIKSWLDSTQPKNVQWAQVEVGPLSDRSLQETLGSRYANLSVKQRTLLSNPQNLYMWLSLTDGKQPSQAITTLQLLQEFWQCKLATMEKGGASTANVVAVVNRLSDWMFRQGRLSAPKSAVLNCPLHCVVSLQSNGIVMELDDTLTFTHQSYYDFAIAQGVVNRVVCGQDLITWLGPRDRQTLARREQLRLVLEWLAEVSPIEYLDAMGLALASSDVRFHIKHLFLESLAGHESPSRTVIEFAVSLLGDTLWCIHAMETVFATNGVFAGSLVDRGLVKQWLSSGDMALTGFAFTVLSAVLCQSPHVVATSLRWCLDQGGNWPEHVSNCIGWRVRHDPDEIFDIRIELLGKWRITPALINWVDLSTNHPRRALRLFVALLEAAQDGLASSAPHVRELEDEDVSALISVAESHPIEVWGALRPLVKSCKYSMYGTYATSLPEAAIDIIIAAGKNLAATNPDVFLTFAHANGAAGEIMETILTLCLASLPPSYADVGCKWLIERTSRFSFGEAIGKPEFSSARTVIQNLSSHCSMALFMELEDRLYHYHDPGELELAKRSLELRRREGMYFPYWGRAQYTLMSALDQQRATGRTNELLRGLAHVYIREPDELLRPTVTEANWVGSTIGDNADRLSDTQWLRIVSDQSIPADGNFTEDFLESSIDQFSRDLERVARTDPERFAKLALRFPKVVNPGYVVAILRALIKPAPTANLSEQESVTFGSILAVLERYKAVDEREVVLNFCRVVGSRAEERWPESIFSRLSDISSSSHDLADSSAAIVYPVKWSGDLAQLNIHDLITNAINSVRGVCAETIAHLLWADVSRLDGLAPTIERLIQDFHPAVRLAAVEICLPVLGHNPDKALDWLCKATTSDLRIAASPHSIRLISYAVRAHSVVLGPLIRKMMNDDSDEVCFTAAQMVTAYNLFHGLFPDELDNCLCGTSKQRAGVASVSAENIGRRDYAERCRQLIGTLLISGDAEVSKSLSRMFQHGALDLEENAAVIRDYVASPTFIDGLMLFHTLNMHTGPLIPYSGIILEACKSVTRPQDTRAEPANKLGYQVSNISALLLRLYDEASGGHPAIFGRCLDAWDMLFEAKAQRVRELTRLVDNPRI